MKNLQKVYEKNNIIVNRIMLEIEHNKQKFMLVHPEQESSKEKVNQYNLNQKGGEIGSKTIDFIQETVDKAFESQVETL